MSSDPICCIAVLEASAGADPSAAQAAWLANDPIRQLAPGARYRRSVPVASEERGFRPKQVFGVAQIWVDGVAAALDLCARLKTPGLADAVATVHATRERVVIDGPELAGGTDGIKGWYFSTRKPGMAVEAFQTHWRDVHGPLVAPSPGISRYVQFFPCPETYGGELTPKFDSLAELSFPDAAAQAAFSASDDNAIHQRNDLPNLWDMTGGVQRFYLARHDERAAAEA